ncbi:MAG: DUF3305 domain-containing protein [Gammaproteobacteria bacterium]|nr:DUF3305 domain-containing protein [Gammaproteobacteria bacterium]
MANETPIDGMHPLPGTFDISVLLEQRPSINPWLDSQWEVVGISVGSNIEPQGESRLVLVHEQEGVRHFKQTGFSVQLHIDECESYYHNLMSPTPRCFVIANQEDGEAPVPILVSLSFDEAHAYLEGEETVFAVDIPPELYRWIETFVLTHYVPEKRFKRKLKNWSERDGAVSGV